MLWGSNSRDWGMDQKMKQLISKELEQFYCSILLKEIKEKVRWLRAYGVADAEIEAILHKEELLPELTVTKDYKIMVGGDRRREVGMEPLVKTIYLLFLSHPEGIVLKYLPDYRKELRTIYRQLRPQGLTERAEKSIDNVIDSTQNSINEKCARIRKAFSDVLPQHIVRYYTISGKRGEAKKISLPRELVVWE